MRQELFFPRGEFPSEPKAAYIASGPYLLAPTVTEGDTVVVGTGSAEEHDLVIASYKGSMVVGEWSKGGIKTSKGLVTGASNVAVVFEVHKHLKRWRPKQ